MASDTVLEDNSSVNAGNSKKSPNESSSSTSSRQVVRVKPSTAPAFLSPQELLDNARTLGPTLVDRANEAERLGRMPDKTIQEFLELGLMRIMQPKIYGGYEHGLQALLDVAQEVGQHCGSSAWVLTLISLHNWMASLWPEAMQDEFFADNGDAMASITFAPTGVVKQAGEGFDITGSWGYSTGCHHGTWAGVNAIVESDKGLKSYAVFLPRSDYQLEDDWDTTGLAGTGSKRLVVDGAHIPMHRAVNFVDLLNGVSPGSKFHNSLSYKMPLIPVLCFSASAPAIGMARGVITAFENRCKERFLAYTGGKQKDQTSAQLRLAKATAVVDSCEIMLRHDVAELERLTAEGKAADFEVRAKFRMHAGHIVQQCQQAITELYTAYGSTAIFKHCIMQRHFRDVHAISTHAAMVYDDVAELYGQMRLGLNPKTFML